MEAEVGKLCPSNVACKVKLEKSETTEPDEREPKYKMKNDCHPNSDISRLKRSFGECKSIEFNENANGD